MEKSKSKPTWDGRSLPGMISCRPGGQLSGDDGVQEKESRSTADYRRGRKRRLDEKGVMRAHPHASMGKGMKEVN